MARFIIIFIIAIQSSMAYTAGKFSQINNEKSNTETEGTEMYKGLDGVGQWKSMGSKDEIKLFYSDVEGSSFEAFKAEMTVNADLKTLVAMMQDTDRMHKWMYSTKSVKVLEKKSNTESIRYLINEIPYPFMKDRDLVVHTEITQKENGSVSVRMRKKEGIRADVNNLVRIPRLDTIVRFTPQKDGNVLTEYLGHIEPGGIIQPFIFNMMLKDTPHQTMRDFRKILDSYYKKNDHSDIDYISVPG